MTDNAKHKYLPNTDSKFVNITAILIVAVSIVGFIAFAYTAITTIMSGNIFGALPKIMCCVMYYSIIQFCIDSFVKNKMTTVYFMLLNYAMLTLMTTITIPNIKDNVILVILAIIIVILVFLIRNNITAIRNLPISIIVFILVATMTFLKNYYGYFPLDGENPFEYLVSVFNLCHLLFVWIIYLLLYALKTKRDLKYFKERVKVIGKKAARQKYHDDLYDYIDSVNQEKKDKKKARRKKIANKFKSKQK